MGVSTSDPCDRNGPVVLTLDRGNRTLDCRLCGPELDERRRSTPDGAGLEDLLALARPDLAIGLSVVPGGLDAQRLRLGRDGLDLLVAGLDVACPLTLAYPDPESLGVDRWVAAFAAHRRFGAAIVADCGSAVTVDAVTATGRFLGGAIAPGLGALADGLATRAPALPAFDGCDPCGVPPVTSVDGVRAGVTIGFVALVEGLVERIAAAAGLDGVALVLTGGDAPRVQAASRRRFVHVPTLVHDGLRWLLPAPRISDS